jgi:hypothetical protein
MTDWNELAIFISACAASLGGLCAAVQHSRCRNIQTPCISCDREVEGLEVLDALEGGSRMSAPVTVSELEASLERSHVGPPRPRTAPENVP